MYFLSLSAIGLASNLSKVYSVNLKIPITLKGRTCNLVRICFSLFQLNRSLWKWQFCLYRWIFVTRKPIWDFLAQLLCCEKVTLLCCADLSCIFCYILCKMCILVLVWVRLMRFKFCFSYLKININVFKIMISSAKALLYCIS